jgi:hypothetical protein
MRTDVASISLHERRQTWVHAQAHRCDGAQFGYRPGQALEAQGGAPQDPDSPDVKENPRRPAQIRWPKRRAPIDPLGARSPARILCAT